MSQPPGITCHFLPITTLQILNALVAETNVIPVEIDDVRVDLVVAELPFEREAIQQSQYVDFFRHKDKSLSSGGFNHSKSGFHPGKGLDGQPLEDFVAEKNCNIR
jgi:hypothetical protein